MGRRRIYARLRDAGCRRKRKFLQIADAGKTGDRIAVIRRPVVGNSETNQWI
ncbi:hypothetical protein I550_5282 [Mycobacterium intracellulare 1956]|uniref:Uncharacterized protein n=1 Tax=Mycobacterium intracellulare 1956 TaxID=1299331 RepID=X8CC16_MYCIT|nr:hypothetical protein I550_5282 [Mycobacterium intracellulare 1956]